MKFLISCSLLLSFNVFFFNYNPNNMEFDFKKHWNEIVKLEQAGKYQTCLTKANEVFSAAVAESNEVQQMKALFHIVKFTRYTSDEQQDQGIKIFEDQIGSLKSPAAQSLAYSVLAEMYDRYARNNRWRFQDRNLVADDASDDIALWSLEQIQRKANDYYFKSIEENKTATQKDPIEDYQDILLQERDNYYNPILKAKTLYELLLIRSLDHFAKNQQSHIKSVDDFSIQDEFWFGDVKEFSNAKIDKANASGHQYEAIKLFQSAFKYYQNTDRTMLQAVNVRRLKFLKHQSIIQSKDSLYSSRLESTYRSEKNDEAKDLLGLSLIEYYHDQGQKYSSNFDPQFKGFYKKAADILEAGQNGRFKKTYEYYAAVQHQLRVNIIMESHIPSKTDFRSWVSYRNVDKLYYRLTQITKEQRVQYDQINNQKNRHSFLNKLSSMESGSFDLPASEDLDHHAVELPYEGLDYGDYALIQSTHPDFPYNKDQYTIISFFTVTDLSFISVFNIPEPEITVVDRVKGNPLEGVNVELRKPVWNPRTRTNQYDLIERGLTDKDGKYKIGSKERNITFKLTNGKDNFEPINSFYRNHLREDKEAIQIESFVDRPMYRPGQTVYFKALLSEGKMGKDRKVVANAQVNVTFLDANNQAVGSTELTTNEFGSINGSFQIPEGLLNGQFRLVISHKGGMKTNSIRVEEYKRPSFKVVVDSLQAPYKLGDRVAVSAYAESYAGVALAGAKVSYKVMEQEMPRYYCGFYRPYIYFNSSSRLLAVGETTTDKDGIIKIDFQTYLKQSKYLSSQIKIIFDVTDERGESNTVEKDIQMSNASLSINTDLPDHWVDGDLKELNITINNADGKAMAVDASMEIIQLSGPTGLLKSNLWGPTDVNYLKEKDFKSRFPFAAYQNEKDPETWKVIKTEHAEEWSAKQKQILMPSLEGGYYKCIIKAIDDKGNTTEYIKYFMVANGKNTAGLVELWVSGKEQSYQPGENVELQISKSTEQMLHYSLHRSEGEYLTEWHQLDHQSSIQFPIKESDRGGVKVQLWYVENNRFYTREINIIVPWDNKDLSIEYESLRSVMLPGSKEKWKIKISGKDKDKVSAELVASMYDASLDKLAAQEFKWEKSLYSDFHSMLRYQYSAAQQSRNDHFNLYKFPPYYRILDGYTPRLNSFGMLDGAHMYMKRSGGRMKSMPSSASFEMDEVQVMNESAPMGDVRQDSADFNAYDEDGYGDGGGSSLTPGSKAENFDFAPRKNLNELVFFYPELYTDSNGNLIIEFTNNEALTEWKLLMFGHTKSMEYFFDEQLFKTQKDLMILPNVPRFVRHEDKLELTASVSNLSNNAIIATTQIEIKDMLTELDITKAFKIDQITQDVSIAAGEQGKVAWSISVPENQVNPIEIIYKSKSGSHTDGELQIIPVLTNRKLVTETMAMHFPGSSSKDFEFEALNKLGLSSSLTPHQLSFEFTSNPVWFAIKSLPYLKAGEHENALDVTYRIYANSLAMHIIDTYPGIEQVFKSWSKDPEALKSNLSKNQEFKEVLLAQTPWVLDALSEEEQMQNIALLFDRNNIQQELQSNYNKLNAYQMPSGGFTWCKGGRPSTHITESILISLGHLEKLTGKLDQNQYQIVSRGLEFVDHQIKLDYRKYLSKHENLSGRALRYLYMRSFFLDQNDSKPRDVIKGLYAKATSYDLTANNYLNALLALAALRDGKMKITDRIVASLDEQAIKDTHLGTYWKSNAENYGWYDNNLERQSIIIELYESLEKDQQMLDDMKLWLLNNKQTNRWHNSKTTAFAIYALLNNRHKWVMSNKSLEVRIANEPLVKNDLEAGSGYFKSKFPASDIKEEQKNITVKNPNKVVAWGAAYFQYFEDLDKIVSDGDHQIKLSKQLYKLEQSPDGDRLKALSAQDDLTPGDKIQVRIELESDRPMEFMHLKDMRASGLEPVNVISRYKRQDGLLYYEQTKDLSTDFFIEYLPKGKFVFEYTMKLTHVGDYSNGITTLQSMYAPEFAVHSEGVRLKIKN